MANGPTREKEKKKPKKDEEGFRIKTDIPYLERFLNPPEWIEEQRKKLENKESRKQDIKKGLLFPAKPIRDILLFLISFAPLEEWQRDVLDILRQEMYYFLPIGLTKIANEGWAAYWHTNRAAPAAR